jgi:uncharacterized protein (DUF1778 family)
VQFYTTKDIGMAETKNVSVSFRVSPRFKSLLEAAASRERRSQTNMLEALLFAYCLQHGIDVLSEAASSSPTPVRGTSN